MTACLIATPVALVLGTGSAQAENGDTHIISIGSTQTVECNAPTLIVNGCGNTIYGSDQTVFYKSGEPVVWDRCRELGVMNRIDRIPA